MSCPIKLFKRCLLLLICLPLISAADETLEPFDVTYRYSAGVKSAEVRVSLQTDQQQWLWRTEISPTSFLALFSDERLYSDTRFSIENSLPQINQIKLGTDSSNLPTEVAAFNWSEAFMESVRKGKQKRLPLTEAVYDANTIHLLAQELYFSAESGKTAGFYHKGKLTSVSIRYLGLKTIDLDNQARQAELFSVQREDSDALLLYYYEPGEMLYPMKMEHREPQKSTVIMTLTKGQS